METMLEKSSWTHSLERKNKHFALNDEGIPINMKASDFTVLGDQTFDEENNLNDSSTSCTESNLTFFGNDLKDEGHNDLLLYNWLELEIFEDVDDIFRSCDSTFGQDIYDNDNFYFFPSSHTIEGCFDFPSSNPCGQDTVTEQQEVYEQRNNGMTVNETRKEHTLTSCKRDSLKLLPDNRHTDTKSEMYSHVSPSKHQKTSDGKKSDHFSENGVSEAGYSNHLSNSQHNFSPEDHQQRKISHQSCLQTSVPIIKPNNSPALNQILLGSGTSITMSEYNVLPSTSSGESSHVSNQLQTKQNSHDVCFRNPTYAENRKKRKSHQRRSSRHTEESYSMAQRTDSDLLCFKKQRPDGENKAEGRSELSSSTSSVLDGVSFDASSLKQLQHAIVQLDTRTILCMRDSLYRLARSAAQRHKCVTGALLSDGANKCNGFSDIETDTNPIDRSMAHLLFHRPSDTSAASTVNAVAMKSQTTVEPVCKEGTVLVNEEADK